jgi:hypothetical protein
MASISCTVCCSFAAADELAPTDTLRVLRLHRLRLRRAAAGCLDPIAEEEEDDSDVEDVTAAGSPSTNTSNSSSASLDRR